ncbi:MAG: hypothetical protein AAFZ58_15770 [Pseudomonadota bacterium]
MARIGKLSIGTVALATAALLWFLATRQSFDERLSHSAIDDVSIPDAPTPDGTETPELGGPPASTCATLEELHDHPDVDALNAYNDAMTWGDLDFEALLNVEFAKIESMAASGDEAAMAVMARQAEMRATGVDPEYALPTLLHGGRPDNSWVEDLVLDFSFSLRKREYSKEEIEALIEAGQWHYQLALRGRLMSLHRYAEYLDYAKGGPVGLTWLTADHYETLSPQQRRLFDPEIVYADLTGRFIVQNYTIFDHVSLSEDDRKNRDALIERLTAEFTADLTDWRPDSPAEYWRLRSAYNAVMSQACPGALDAYLDDITEAGYRWPETDSQN